MEVRASAWRPGGRSSACVGGAPAPPPPSPREGAAAAPPPGADARPAEELGLARQKTLLEAFSAQQRRARGPAGAAAGPKGAPRPPPGRGYRQPKKPGVKAKVTTRAGARRKAAGSRRSGRLEGKKPEYAEGLGDGEDHVYLEDMTERVKDAVAEQDHTNWKKALEHRCEGNNQWRGGYYDSRAGLTCHFCRQKKLCGEEGCPRCSNRDPELECIGKSECTRCGGARGRFCRACLKVRYGLELDDVRAQAKAGEWLCPHCYEDDHPEEGWICNSSICMTRRGMSPTGIAIYNANEQGFSSVAELVQANILKRRAVAAGRKAAKAKAEHVPLAQRQAKGKGKGKAARK